MIRQLLLGLLALVVSGTGAYGSVPSPAGSFVLTPASDTVHVTPPTGAAATDRASILAALEALEPGGTLLFAAGTYWIGGAFIKVPVPDVILQGHPDGTILRGCEPADLVEHERMTECNGLELTGPRQTIRGFTFEHIGSALWVGCCLEPAAPDLEGGQPHVGGHLIEGNTFRGTWNGIRVIGDSPEAAVIRDNDFVNTWHAVTVNGRTAHILGNRVSVPDPEEVPVNGHAGIAIAVVAHDTMLERAFTCAGNVIAGNRIEGHPEAIGILAWRSGASCRENVIRDNIITAARVRFPGPSWGVIGIREPTDSTLAGVPIALADLSAQMAEFLGLPAGDHDEDLIHGNGIEGNRVTGADGLAIQLVGASRNRVVGNTITGVRRREPFPGNTMIDDPEPWREANGSGIWISPGSDGNVVTGNAFEDVAAYEVFMVGDGNRVELQSADDSVRDLGRGNEVTRAGGDGDGERSPEEQTSDTVRVAPPTGEREADRAAILAALEQSEPGGTVLFAPGTYLIGEFIRVSVPRVTLQGHPDGTTLRGCDPAGYPEYEVQLLSCNGLELAAGQQTVRNLTIEHAWHGIHIGCCVDQVMESIRTGEGGPPRTQPGGHLIENNRLRSVGTAMRVIGESSDPIVIRRNVFRNVFHALVINGGTAHMLDNDISSPEPELVPAGASSGGAIGIFPAPPARECGENVIAGNRIEGHPDGIGLSVGVPGTRCERNVVRDNTIIVRRVPILKNPFGIRIGSESDSTVVGVPIQVTNMVGVEGALPIPPAWELEGETVIGGNRIEDNRVMGAEGIGIEIRRSSGNRIADNVVTGIARRDPFPGNLVNSADPESWREANGSGIWVSPGSDGNEIVSNVFEDIASHAVVVEGDRNRVETRSASDIVRDLGSENEVRASPGEVLDEGFLAGSGGSDTVHVAPPTGDRNADRASILGALAQVRPGGTVQFGPGTYVIGEIISVTVPRVTLLGHPDGTTLRGCDPDRLGTREYARAHCNGLELAGARQIVRGLTFEYAHWALHLGCCQGERAMLRAPDGSLVEGPAIYRTDGGHVVEGNTFRRSNNGIRMNGDWTEPAIVRNNRFIDNWHSVSINGNTVHLLDNDFSVPEPERVPFYGFPWDAVKIGPPLPLQETDETLVRACAHNIVAGNRIDGSPDGIRIEIYEPGTSCRRNVIRDNTITVRRVRAPAPERWFTLSDESDSTFVGIPIALLNYPEAFGQNEPGRESFLEDNLIEGNRIIGADGLGFEVLHASRNRIVNNTISGIAVRNPFPGNALGPRGETGALEWREADGAGIWLSPGSDENEIAGNTFDDIASYAVVLEGDRNRVETHGSGDPVRDLGSGNRVMRAGHPAAHLEALYRARTDSARTRFSAADVRFMSGMIAHHAQAIVMSRLAPSRDASPAVRLLAERIINAQEDEIALLQQWLRERGQPVPEVDLTLATRTAHGPAHAAHAHGMLTGEQLRALEAATAREFDRLFLESMIRHHLGAITMVDELFSTDAAEQDPAVSRLAAAIHSDQAAEIVRMRRMLAELSLTGRIR